MGIFGKLFGCSPKIGKIEAYISELSRPLLGPVFQD